VVDDEHGALLRSQLSEAAFELIGGCRRALRVRAPLRLERFDLDLPDPMASLPARLRVAGVDDQPMEPRVEPVRISDRMDMEPRADQGVLDSVGGEVVGAKDQSRRPVQSLETVGDQNLESVSVASPGAKD